MIFNRQPTRSCSLGTVENLGDGRVFYRLHAGMTFELIPQLRIELLEVVDHYRPERMIFELAQLNRFGGAGLAILVEMLRHLPPRARLYLAHVHKEVRGIIDIAGLTDLVTIVDDLPATQAAEILAGSTSAVPASCPGCGQNVDGSTAVSAVVAGGVDARGH